MSQNDKKNLSLVPLLCHFVGMILDVELKNGQVFSGELTEIDHSMNVVLMQAESSDESNTKYASVHLRGSSILYIHFPPNADLPKIIKLGQDRVRASQNKYQRGKMRVRKV